MTNAGAVLYAKNPARVANFYATALGLLMADRDEEHIRLESQSFQLVVLRIPDAIASTITIAEPAVRRTNAAVKLVFLVPSIADARAHAPDLGGQVNNAGTEWSFDGCKVCDGADPEGNVIQLRERRG